MRYALVVNRVVLQKFMDEAKRERELLDAAIRALEILSVDRRPGGPKGSKNKQKTASAEAASSSRVNEE